MNRSLIISSVLHALLIFITAMSLPFLAKKPLDIPPIVSVELIQIAEKTNIPFAPKAKKIIEKVKEKEKKLVSEQAPPKKVEKTKTKTVLSPEQNIKKIENETPEAIPLPEKTLMGFSLYCYSPIFGRSGGNRTPNLRFWRPALYQLSYTPIEFTL